jgi:rod shape-determining protein MreB
LNALISGRAGVALIRSDNSLMSMHIGRPARDLVPRTAADWNFLIGHARDLQMIENATLEDVERALDAAHKRTLALDLTLILLDPDLSDGVRRRAAEELEPLLQEPLNAEALESVLYATPLPAVADLEGARHHSETVTETQSLLTRLAEHQPAVRAVVAAWQQAMYDLHIDVGHEDWKRFHRAAVESGLFRALVQALPESAIQTLLARLKSTSAAGDVGERDRDRALAEWMALSRRQTVEAVEAGRAGNAMVRPVGAPSGDIAIDLGTTHIRVYASGRGIVVDEPSIAAVVLSTNRVEAVGREAKVQAAASSGRLKEWRFVRPLPIEAGIFRDSLRRFVAKAYHGRAGVQGRVVLSVPGATSSTDVRTLKAHASAALDTQVHVIDEALAAAVGTGLSLTPPGGRMLVDIGGGSTDITVISPEGIVFSKSLRVAGNELNEAIIQSIKRRYNVLIGERTAERIKFEIGSVWLQPNALAMEVKGRDLIAGVPKTIVVNDQEVREALDEPVSVIVEAIRVALERLPAGLSRQVAERGIVLTGGGALLGGFVERLKHDLRMPMARSEEPSSTVVLGTGRILGDVNLLQRAEALSGFAQ